VWQPCELLYTCYYTDGPWPHDPFTCSAHPLILRRLHLAVSVQHRSGVCPSSHVSVCSVEQILNATLEESAVARPAYVAALLCEGRGSKPTAVGRSQLLARWPGTHSRILSAIRRAAQTVLGVYLKRTSSRVTSASSALAVLSVDYALYKSTHSLTHCLETWTPTDTPPHSFASCPSAASPHFLSSRQLFNQWSERREGTSPRRSCSRRRRPRTSHGGGGGGFSAND